MHSPFRVQTLLAPEKFTGTQLVLEGYFSLRWQLISVFLALHQESREQRWLQVRSKKGVNIANSKTYPIYFSEEKHTRKFTSVTFASKKKKVSNYSSALIAFVSLKALPNMNVLALSTSPPLFFLFFVVESGRQGHDSAFCGLVLKGQEEQPGSGPCPLVAASFYLTVGPALILWLVLGRRKTPLGLPKLQVTWASKACDD